MTTVTAGAALNFDTFRLGSIGSHVITSASSTFASATGGGITDNFYGQFLYDGAGNLAGGTLTGFTQVAGGVTLLSLSQMAAPVPELAYAILNNSALGQLSIFNGADHISGSMASDLLRGQAGNDLIYGQGAADILFGGTGDDSVYGDDGNDVIYGDGGANYLRGGAGDDLIRGGDGFDDAHGNMGNDTVYGGVGNDWVVGGKDNDQLYGEAGNDIVYGNMADDTCQGGLGDDLIRGGQDNDILYGEAGDDWLSGDRHSDTISGGAGADVFHTFGDAGIDRVLDFNRAEGDRVQLDPGTVYTFAQSGGDVVISMQGGAQMVLVNVNIASLTEGWIFTL